MPLERGRFTMPMPSLSLLRTLPAGSPGARGRGMTPERGSSASSRASTPTRTACSGPTGSTAAWSCACSGRPPPSVRVLPQRGRARRARARRTRRACSRACCRAGARCPRYRLEVGLPRRARPSVVRDAYSFAPVARRARPPPHRRGPPRAALGRARRASAHARRHHGHGLRRLGARRARRQRRRRLQRLERARAPDALARRRRRLGAVRPRGGRGPRLQVRDPRRRRRRPPQGRPRSRCAPSCRRRPARSSSSRITAGRDAEWLERRRSVEPHAAPMSIYEVHLGSWRLNTLEGNRSLTYARAGRRARRLRARPRLHARRADAGHGAPVHGLVGLPGDRLLRARPRATARPTTSAPSSTGCTRAASA